MQSTCGSAYPGGLGGRASAMGAMTVSLILAKELTWGMANAGWLATRFKRSINDSLRFIGCAFDIALRCCIPFCCIMLSALDELAPPAEGREKLILASQSLADRIWLSCRKWSASLESRALNLAAEEPEADDHTLVAETCRIHLIVQGLLGLSLLPRSLVSI